MQRATRMTMLLRRLSNSKPLRPLPSFSFSFSSSSSLSNPKTLTQESVLYVLKTLDKKPTKALEFFNHITSTSDFKPGPAAYNLMLRILSVHKDHLADHLADFWLFLKSMDSAGHKIDSGTYITLIAKFKNLKMPAEIAALTQFHYQKANQSAEDESIQSLSKLILQDDDSDYQKQKKFKLSLSEIYVAKVLREVNSAPLKALGFFRWAASARGAEYTHGSTAYNAMARVLGREESVKEFWELVEEMKGKGVDIDIDTYIKLQRQFFKSKMIEDAVKLYEFVMDGPYKPNVRDCGVLLRQICLSEAPDLNLINRVVNKFEATGHALEKVVYDGIHRALTSNGRFEEAVEIMKKMRGEGHEPDNITYSQLVYGLCKANQLDKACEVLSEMEEGGFIPDLKTWTVLVQGHCAAGEVDKGYECMTKMIGKGIDADGDMVEVLVKGLCGQKRVDGAYALVTEMVHTASVRVWQSTYKYLIPELLKEHKLEEALKMIALMKTHK